MRLYTIAYYSMATVDQTFLDDPVTPAPIFAYRAVSHWIFGSPDPNTSPERQVSINNKENVSPQRPGTIKEEIEKCRYTSILSPQKRKRGNEPLSMPLSPSKTLGVPLSPSKGILRTPGVLTPRAKSLRDVKVKFRSLSPEVRRKEVVAEIVLRDVDIMGQKSGYEEKKSKKVRTVSEPVTKQMTVAAARPREQEPAMVLLSEYETYTKNTEKEMRRLIKRNQKYKDYARILDEDNMQLKQLLEQAQKDNALLERKLRLIESGRTTNQQLTVPDADARDLTSQRNLPGHAVSGLRNASRKDFEIPQSTEDRSKRQKLRDPAVSKPNLATSLEKRLSDLRHSSVPSLTTNALPTRPPKPKHEISHPSKVSQKPAFPDIRSLSSSAPVVPSPLTALAQRLEPNPSPHTSARCNLAPERYSAARQRLLQRQQARKPSAAAHAPSEDKDESNVDWANLG